MSPKPKLEGETRHSLLSCRMGIESRKTTKADLKTPLAELLTQGQIKIVYITGTTTENQQVQIRAEKMGGRRTLPQTILEILTTSPDKRQHKEERHPAIKGIFSLEHCTTNEGHHQITIKTPDNRVVSRFIFSTFEVKTNNWK